MCVYTYIYIHKVLHACINVYTRTLYSLDAVKIVTTVSSLKQLAEEHLLEAKDRLPLLNWFSLILKLFFLRVLNIIQRTTSPVQIL